MNWSFGLLLASTFSARADVLVYSDRTSWETASKSIENLTFAGLGGLPGDAGFPDKWYPGGLVVDGVTFTGSTWGAAPYMFVRSSSPNFLLGPPDGSLGCPFQIDPPCPLNANIEVTLPPGVTSVGWDFGNFYLPGVTVDFLNGIVKTDPAFTGFIGFISTDPIARFDSDSAGFPTVTDFSYSTAIPEPQSVVLLLTVIAALAGLRYYRWSSAGKGKN